MTALRFLALLLLLGASAGPGLWLVRKLRWSPLERLVAAIAASGLVLYLASALIYVLRLPRVSECAVSVACLGFAVAARAQIRLLLGSREVRRALGAFAFLFVWALLLLAMVRTYSGGQWAGDWIEHYQRTRFFLEHQPMGTLFIGQYVLPVRPPFMNLLGAHFLAQVGERYDLFQVVFTFLNLLAFFPCWLIARLMVPRAGGRTGRIALLCLFAASPLFLENATFAWTKGLANFYVIAGLWFYLRGWRRSDPFRLAASCLAFAAGILVHYSAVPYAILVLLHYLLFVLPRRAPGSGKKLLVAALPGAALLGSWVGWSMTVYGWRATFGSNTTTQAAGAMSPAENIRKVALNLFYSIVPHPLHLGYRGFGRIFFQPSGWGFLRDYYFTVVQTTLVCGMGCLGGLVVLFLLWRVAKSPAAAGMDRRRFWLGLVLLGSIFTVATHPTVEVLGVAHVCSQPLLLLGLTFLAASFASLSGPLRAAVLLGCVVDFLAGIFLHFSLQERTAAIRTVAGQPNLELTTALLNPQAVANLSAKEKLGYLFWGDHFAGVFPALQLLVLVLCSAVLFGLIRAMLNPRAPGRRAGAVLWGLPALPLALGAACAAGIRAEVREFTPVPPGLEACVQAAQQNFDSGAARYNLGLALYRNGSAGQAIEQWTEALMLQPDHALARYFAQVAGIVSAVPVSADLADAEAVGQFPNAAEARVELAGALWNRKHAAPAVSELERAGQLKPADPDIHYALACALYQMGRTSEAIGHLRAALKLRPAFPEAQAALQEMTAPARP